MQTAKLSPVRVVGRQREQPSVEDVPGRGEHVYAGDGCGGVVAPFVDDEPCPALLPRCPCCVVHQDPFLSDDRDPGSLATGRIVTAPRKRGNATRTNVQNRGGRRVSRAAWVIIRVAFVVWVGYLAARGLDVLEDEGLPEANAAALAAVTFLVGLWWLVEAERP